ncbi:hypothetical protein [Aquimarina spongiae]|nr:hypothetical protein [Aquimarina spongiae]
MRKLTILFLSILTISCSSEDDTPNFEGHQSDLKGTWLLSKIEFEGTDIIDFCYKKSTITVSSTGYASWVTFSKTYNVCESNTGTFVFKGLNGNVNFTIEGNQPNISNYYGRFYSANKIQITKKLNTNDELTSTTIYEFQKQ